MLPDGTLRTPLRGGMLGMNSGSTCQTPVTKVGANEELFDAHQQHRAPYRQLSGEGASQF
jgi:hypothetical protein